MAKIMLSNVRVTFLSVFRKQSFEGNEGKYSVQLIIPKDHKDLPKLKQAIAEAAQAKFPGKVKDGKIAASLKTPLRDGDVEKGEYDAYANGLFANATTQIRPRLLNRDKSPLMEDDDVLYNGCYVNVVVQPFAYDSHGNKGVSLGLMGMQFFKDGEPLGGSNACEDMFEEVEEEDIYDFM